MFRIAIVHIDEMQHATHVANDKEILRLGASLKSLLVNPDWPVMLVVAGIPILQTFLDKYPELQRRTTHCHFSELNAVDDAGDIVDIASSLCNLVGLTLNINGCDHFGERLITAANLQFGGVIEWTIEAIGIALSHRANTPDPNIRLDPFIDHNDFAAAYTEKKDCKPIDNAFLRSNWSEVWQITDLSHALSETQHRQRAKRNHRRNF